jgi:hypothetical protein
LIIPVTLMHIKIELRGYDEEKNIIEQAKKRLEHFINQDLSEILAEEIGWENLEEDEEFLAMNFNVHLYQRKDYDEEKYYGCY